MMDSQGATETADPGGSSKLAQLRELGLDITALPTMSGVVAKVLSLTGSDKANASDVAAWISQDPALSARILRIVNSAFYGLRATVATVQRAVVILGFSRVRGMVLGAAAAESLRGLAPQAPSFALRDFWYHSAATADLASGLCRRAFPERVDEAFTAGLLHDIGGLLLAVHAGDAFEECIHAARATGRPLEEVERERLGLDHGEVGAQAAKRWNLPPSLEAAIRFHDHPSEAGESGILAAVTRVAEVMALRDHPDAWEYVGEAPEIDPALWERLREASHASGALKPSILAAELGNRSDSVRGLAHALMVA
jgi:HD-like signal output (HDOD) protein